MRWDAPREFLVNKPVSLKFSVHDQNGAGVPIETYLGMRGHMALRRDDGSVFTHLHPGGSPSMAAMQLSVLRTQGELPLKAAFGADEPLCQLPALSEREQEWLRGNSSPDNSTVSFPYAFPRTGRYRFWVQVTVQGQILTGVFDAEVAKAATTARDKIAWNSSVNPDR